MTSRNPLQPNVIISQSAGRETLSSPWKPVKADYFSHYKLLRCLPVFGSHLGSFL